MIDLAEIFNDIHVEVKKEEDLVFNGIHPNGINIGYTKVGKITQGIVGERMNIHGGSIFDYLSTSIVKEIEKIDDKNYKVITQNSIYTVKEL